MTGGRFGLYLLNYAFYGEMQERERWTSRQCGHYNKIKNILTFVVALPTSVGHSLPPRRTGTTNRAVSALVFSPL
jgi:hypothetical protein